MITHPLPIAILIIMPIVQALPVYRAIKRNDYTNFRFDIAVFIASVITSTVILLFPQSIMEALS